MAVDQSTIFALSSGLAAGGDCRGAPCRDRVRGAALQSLSGACRSRAATLARVRDPVSGEVIDEALALWFPAPQSETGEPWRSSIHGGQLSYGVSSMRSAGWKVAVRPSLAIHPPGFENGQFDLTGVEGLADLIAAETLAQRRQAFRSSKA